MGDDDGSNEAIADPAVPPPEVPEVALGGEGEGRPSRRPLVAAAAVLAVVLLAGTWAIVARDDDSVSRGAGPDVTVPASELWGHRWRVLSIDEGGRSRALAGRSGEQIVLDATAEGKLSFNGCNGGFGTAALEGSKLVAGQFGSTEMACTGADGDALMAQDAWFATFLSSGPDVSIEEGTLTLSTPEATVVLADRGAGPSPETTVPADDPDAAVSDEPSLPDPGHGTSVPGPTVVEPDGPAGGSTGGGSLGSPGADGIWGNRWRITAVTVDGVDRAIVGVGDEAAPTLDLTADAQVSFDGCNGGLGAARVEGDRLVVDGIGATMMACAGPDGDALMAQDARLATLLDADPSIRIEGDTLTLEAGNTSLVAVRV